MYVVDTETVQYVGDTVLIQYSTITGDPILHHIFKSSARATLNLLEDICKKGIIAFNLAFDAMHLSQTYNILRVGMEEGVLDPESILSINKYFEVKHNYDVFKYCWKPERNFDAMLYGRKNVFQSTMNRSPIWVRKVPRRLADDLIAELQSRIILPDTYFADKPERTNKWDIVDIEDEDGNILEEICDVRLRFYPSTRLKAIGKCILGYDVLQYEEEIEEIEEKGYLPLNPEYKKVLPKHVAKWHKSKRQQKYASDDIRLTQETLAYLYCQNTGQRFPDSRKERLALPIEEWVTSVIDSDSTDYDLAIQVGNCYWSGYSVDNDTVLKNYEKSLTEEIKNREKINFNSPKQVVEALRERADEFDAALIENSSKDTLKILSSDCEPPLSDFADFILGARKNSKNLNVLKKLHEAGRLHAMFKVVGTKSNRMAGGSMAGKTKGGSVNPQGINKGGGIRDCVTFADAGMILEGGDFSGFEVSIMEAIYKDPRLAEELKSGKKFHAIWGSIMYDKPYEEILEDEELYIICKIAVFAEAYGADVKKLANITGLTPEIVGIKKQKFEELYPEIGKRRSRTNRIYSALKQGENGKIEWHEPMKYIESLLGFRRYFSAEYAIMKSIHELALSLPEEMEDITETVTRGSRVQTMSSAVKSALFGAAFSIQNSIIRAAGNHEIQSVGGELTKRLQARFWKLQPTGCHEYLIKPFNVHDEVDIAMKPELIPSVHKIRDEFVEEYQGMIPLLKMDWESGKTWGEIH